MSTENHQIDHYQYEFVSEASGKSSRGLMYLFLYGAHKELLCAIACVPGKIEHAPAAESAGGHIRAEMGEFQMRSLLDMLRNEKPAYFSWTPETQTVRVTTNKEPVGEQEVRKMFSFLYI